MERNGTPGGRRPRRPGAVLAASLVLAAAVSSIPASAGPQQAATPATDAAPRTISTSTATGDPRRNIPPQPNYYYDCATKGYNNQTCIHEALKAINAARAREHVRTMVLPRNYRSLSIAEQTFVIVDLERVDRGLKPFRGLTRFLNHSAHAAAVSRLDPVLGTSAMNRFNVDMWSSIWAGDYGPLSSDYDWMYNDGYAKSAANRINIACTTPKAAGCWGHRHNILNHYRRLRVLSAGAGTAKPKGSSIAAMFTAGSGNAPHYVFTWKQARAHGAGAH
jgi:hypothetical protein